MVSAECLKWLPLSSFTTLSQATTSPFTPSLHMTQIFVCYKQKLFIEQTQSKTMFSSFWKGDGRCFLNWSLLLLLMVSHSFSNQSYKVWRGMDNLSFFTQCEIKCDLYLNWPLSQSAMTSFFFPVSYDCLDLLCAIVGAYGEVSSITTWHGSVRRTVRFTDVCVHVLLLSPPKPSYYPQRGFKLMMDHRLYRTPFKPSFSRQSELMLGKHSGITEILV